MSVIEEATGQRTRRAWMIFCVVAVAAVSAAGWLRLRIDSSLEPLLPENNQARQTLLFLRDSTFADKAVLWYRLTGAGSLSDLIAAADATEKQLDPKLITRVIHPPSESNALDQAIGLLDHAGELLNENDLADLQKAAQPDALRQRMRDIYMQLTRPEGDFLQQIIRRDPLGISTRILSRLYALTSGLGYRVQIQDGHFVSSDGRQLLVILETSATATSLASSEALVAHLEHLCAAAPPGVSITPICGQIHTEQNERLMRRDIHMGAFINGIGFLLLFLLVSRDVRVAAVFLLPLVTTGLTIGLYSLFHPNVSAMVIGLSVAMAGSAVDYGIYVYTAVRMGTDRRADMRRIRRPIFISHLTTLGVFVAFVFSKVPAYRQLGYITSISLILSLLAALFILPRLLRPGGRIVGLGSGMPLSRWGKAMVPVTVIAGILLIAAIFFASKIRFDSDVTRLDGVSPAVRQAEADFQKTWGRSDVQQALLVVTARTKEAAEQANDEISNIVSPRLFDAHFTSLSSVWPSPATRAANEARWRAFWSPRRIAHLRHDLAVAGQPYGFSSSAFDPFFDNLAKPPAGNPPPMIADIEDQFSARSGNDWQILSYFDDTPRAVKIAEAAITDWPQAEVVSRGVLASALKQSAVSETHLLVGISLAFIIASVLLLTRSIRKSILILLPVLTGLIAMLAVLEIMGLSMSLLTVIAAIIVLALGSDYGIFAAYAWDGRETILGQGMASIHISFLTTLVGVGVMLFAKHPALFVVSVSLTSGLLAGYLTAFLVIPAICYLWPQPRTA